MHLRAQMYYLEGKTIRLRAQRCYLENRMIGLSAQGRNKLFS